MKILSIDLRGWGKENDWYTPCVHTNEYRFNQQFAKGLKEVMLELGEHNQNIIAMLIHDAKSNLLNKCRKFDDACREGCRNEEESIELEYIYKRVLILLEELAYLLQRAEDAHSSDGKNITDDGDEWISLSDAANILGLAPGTVGRLIDKGQINDNGLENCHRKVSKISVLVEKERRDNQGIYTMAGELRLDSAKIDDEGY